MACIIRDLCIKWFLTQWQGLIWPRLQQVGGDLGWLHCDGGAGGECEGGPQPVQAVSCQAAAGQWSAQPLSGMAAF